MKEKPLPILYRGGENPIPEATQNSSFESAFIMAENADKTAKVAKANKTSPAEFIRQVQTEGRKVVWPTWPDTVRIAIFVFIMMTILSLFFLGVDSLFGALVRWLLTLA
tara:strand:+ start:528 stop:854 length:327 start_codon:yes stop_codon:yes gene_type:complete